MGVLACQALIVAAVLLAWQWLADKGSIGKATFSTPSGIWSALRGWAVDGTLWTNAWSTIQVLMIGWAIGVALGTALLTTVNQTTVRITMGVLLVLYSVYGLLRPALGPVKGSMPTVKPNED